MHFIGQQEQLLCKWNLQDLPAEEYFVLQCNLQLKPPKSERMRIISAGISRTLPAEQYLQLNRHLVLNPRKSGHLQNFNFRERFQEFHQF